MFDCIELCSQGGPEYTNSSPEPNCNGSFRTRRGVLFNMYLLLDSAMKDHFQGVKIKVTNWKIGPSRWIFNWKICDVLILPLAVCGIATFAVQLPIGILKNKTGESRRRGNHVQARAVIWWLGKWHQQHKRGLDHSSALNHNDWKKQFLVLTEWRANTSM